MTYKELFIKVSNELNIPEEVVREAYVSYWKYIRHKIQELPLKENLTEEEFNKLRTNFNIPSIGKLSCTYDRYKAIKDKFKHIKKLRHDSNNKEGQANV